jgi:hypothetical protein
VLLLLGLGLAGCSALACRPAVFEVAGKEERARVVNQSRGLYRTTGNDRLEPVQAPGVEREYWVRSEAGEWHRVTAEEFERAEVGHLIETCR